MKILDAGHVYFLENYDTDKPNNQPLVFMKRESKDFPFNKGSFPGTNCQEVLRALMLLIFTKTTAMCGN